MAIDITSCLNIVNTLKGYISACFSKCTEKGSTFSDTQILANLESAIDAIPEGGTTTKPVVTAIAGDSRVTLKWRVVENATAYGISIVLGNGKYNTLTTTYTNTSYEINDLTNGTTYTFLVQAKVDGKWNSFTSDDYVSATPTSSGIISENINGESFDLFTVTKPTDDPYPNEFTIDFGSVGVTWRSIVCYSDTKDGHFSIHKISGNKCIISASIFYNSENMWDESTGIFPEVRGTYRATYTISGNTISFVNAEYDATSNGSDSYDDFASMPNQVSNAENSYFTDQYKLDKIIVCV